jgi:hypothetical protein
VAAFGGEAEALPAEERQAAERRAIEDGGADAPEPDEGVAKAIAMLEPVDLSDEEREAIDAAGADTDDGGETTIRSRPIIVVHPGTLSELATLGEAAIIAGGAQVYRRGEALVRPVIEEVDASDGRRTKVAQLAEINRDTLFARSPLPLGQVEKIRFEEVHRHPHQSAHGCRPDNRSPLR